MESKFILITVLGSYLIENLTFSSYSFQLLSITPIIAFILPNYPMMSKSLIKRKSEWYVTMMNFSEKISISRRNSVWLKLRGELA